jgi:dihydrofolate reductase
VTDGGITAAVDRARDLAGEKDVALATPDVVRQALQAGLLDEITLDLVPVLVGAGLHYFEALGTVTVALEDPEIIPGRGVTHLRYRLRR